MIEVVLSAFFISVVLIILTMILRGNMQAEEEERKKKQAEFWKQYEKELNEKYSDHRIELKE